MAEEQDNSPPAPFGNQEEIAGNHTNIPPSVEGNIGVDYSFHLLPKEQPTHPVIEEQATITGTPLQTSTNPNAGFPNSPSPCAYRGPITPGPSLLPVLGSGSGVSDKAKFMSTMSEIYDRATSHKNCVTIEEVDRRMKDTTNGLQQETQALRMEVEALRKLVQKELSVKIRDGDVDVDMKPQLPPTVGDGTAATLKEDHVPKGNVTDLLFCIRGLYRLLDLISEQGSGGAGMINVLSCYVIETQPTVITKWTKSSSLKSPSPSLSTISARVPTSP